MASIGLAVVAGRAAYGQELARAQLDERAGYQAAAKVTSTKVSSADPQSGTSQRMVTIAWRDPDDQRHQQRLVVANRKRAGSTVNVWVDADGHASLRKPPDSRTFAAGLGAGVLTVFLSTCTLALAYTALLLALYRRRMAAWAKEWSVVEPQWRRQVL
ncbi:MAG: hypothetical protein GEV07_07645 [Streptosporangiales bacterium]|nr:hypothetical protein [Streptosporangiales bacterium]